MREKLIIKTQYQPGDMVYLVHDPEPQQRMITALTLTFNGVVTYSLQCGTECTEHYAEELQYDKPIR